MSADGPVCRGLVLSKIEVHLHPFQFKFLCEFNLDYSRHEKVAGGAPNVMPSEKEFLNDNSGTS